MSPKMCPNCGFNLEAEQIIEIGALRFDPNGPAHWRGAAIHLTPDQRLILGGLVLSPGIYVRRELLENRIGYEGVSNVLAAQVSKLRATFRAVGAEIIKFEPGAGYCIDVAACEAAK